MGLQRENIIKWPLNGIEYYYPPTILDRIFGEGEALDIIGDRVSRNGISHLKNELVEKVVASIEMNTPQNNIFEDMFLQKLAAKVG